MHDACDVFPDALLFVAIYVVFISAVIFVYYAVGLLEPRFCIVCYGSHLPALVHGLGHVWLTCYESLLLLLLFLCYALLCFGPIQLFYIVLHLN